jgi:hypothetical protein
MAAMSVCVSWNRTWVAEHMRSLLHVRRHVPSGQGERPATHTGTQAWALGGLVVVMRPWPNDAWPRPLHTSPFAVGHLPSSHVAPVLSSWQKHSARRGCVMMKALLPPNSMVPQYVCENQDPVTGKRDSEMVASAASSNMSV